MSDTIPGIPTQAPTTTSDQLPTAAIVCIAVGGYVVLVVIILVIRQCCMARGMCGQWDICGKEGQPQCCECCISLAESCDCCKSPSISSCLDSLCPNRKTYTCVDMVLCQCCSDSNGETCCNCGTCQCSCGCNPHCEDFNCCCFQLHLEPASPRSSMSPRNLNAPRSSRQQVQMTSSSLQNLNQVYNNTENVPSPRQQSLSSSVHPNRQLPTRPGDRVKNSNGQLIDEIMDFPDNYTASITDSSFEENSQRFHKKQRHQGQANQRGPGLGPMETVPANQRGPGLGPLETVPANQRGPGLGPMETVPANQRGPGLGPMETVPANQRGPGLGPLETVPANQRGPGLGPMETVPTKKRGSPKNPNSSQCQTKDVKLANSKRLKSDDSKSSVATGMYPLKPLRSQPRLSSKRDT